MEDSKIIFDVNLTPKYSTLLYSEAYYHDRGGRRSEVHSRAAAAASEASSVFDSRSLVSEHSPQQGRHRVIDTVSRSWRANSIHELI